MTLRRILVLQRSKTWWWCGRLRPSAPDLRTHAGLDSRQTATFPGDVSSLPKGLALGAPPAAVSCAGMTAPALPSTCCMSGCANCVWLDYAELVVKFYERRGAVLNLEDLLGEIDNNVEDEMIKAFIKMEVKSRYMFNK